MIVQENISETLVKTYSDQEMMIRSLETGALYPEAIDPIIYHREYEETDIPINPPEPEPEPEPGPEPGPEPDVIEEDNENN